jgi:hypothetical protein
VALHRLWRARVDREASVNASGAVLILAGVWVCTQVLGGRALQRLGVIKEA